MHQQPLHPFSPSGPTAGITVSYIYGDFTSFIAPAVLRRLADPGQGAPAALAFLSLNAAQRGPGWVQQTVPALLDWLTDPHVTISSLAPHHSSRAPTASQLVQYVALTDWTVSNRPCADGDGCGVLGGRAPGPQGHNGRQVGLWLEPRALGFPKQLQLQLRQLLAALPRCPKLYDSLDERRRRVLQHLLGTLPRSSSAVGAGGGAVAGTFDARRTQTNAVATTVKALAGGVCPPNDSATAPDKRAHGERAVGGAQAGTAGRTTVAWVQAALQASRLRYRRRPAPIPSAPTQSASLGHMGAAASAAAAAEAAAEAVPAPDPATVLVPVKVLQGASRGCGDPKDGGGGGDSQEDGRVDCRCEGVAWWWIPEVPEIHPPNLGSLQDEGEGEAEGAVPGLQPAVAAPGTPGDRLEEGEAGAARRRRQRQLLEGRTIADGNGHTAHGDGDETKRQQEEAARTAHGPTSASPSGPLPASGRGGATGAASPPSAKRLRTSEAELGDPPAARKSLAPEASRRPVDGVSGIGSRTAAAGQPGSLGEVLQALKDAVGDTGDGGVQAATPETWRRLEGLLERCAGSGLPYKGGAEGTAAVGVAPPLPADAVLLLVRQLVTARLSGAAARLLLGAAVLPAVAAVERVMPRPLQEALAAAGGPHPRPLTESVLVPAVQRPQLSAGGAQLLVKAVTTGSQPLPRALQALVLRAACAAAADWGEPHVAVVQGLVEAAAREGLDQETLGLVCQGLCTAAKAQQQQQQQQQHRTARGAASGGGGGSVPLCRLLLSLLSKHGTKLTRPLLQQLHEAACSTSTFLTKPCLAKLQELMGAGG